MFRSLPPLLLLPVPLLLLEANICSPFIYVSTLWTALAIAGAAFSRIRLARNLWTSAAAFFAMLAIAEWGVGVADGIHEPFKHRASDETGAVYMTGHPLLGFALQEGVAKDITVHNGLEVAYRARYTIAADGWRVRSPQEIMEPDRQGVMFLGGSYTFGEGLNDHQTLPYQVEVQSKGRLKAYNFGCSGYGTHQVLAILENNLEHDIVSVPPRHVVYSAIGHHIPRLAGLVWWDSAGPHYDLKGGSVVFAGQLSERSFWNPTRLFSSLAPLSPIGRRLMTAYEYSDANIELFVRAVGRAREIVRRRYPGCGFHILFWDDGLTRERFEALVRALETAGNSVLPIPQVLPDKSQYPEKYRIGGGDIHPNAAANEQIAEYLVKKVLLTSE